MSDGVHAGRSRQPRRQTQRQFGIADRAFRDQVRGNEFELPAILQRDQGCPADLASRSGRRRDGDHRRYGGGDPGNASENGGILFKRPLVGRQQGNPLGQVDRRSAAHRDQAVTAMFPIHGQRGFNGFLGRVRGRPRENGQVGAGTGGSSDFGNEFCLRYPFVGDNQGLGDTKIGQILPNSIDGAELETDRRQI